jgi:ABC-2 type transport system ATP-binding protein
VPDSQADVRVSSLTKTFVVPEREAGLRAALGSLFHRSTREVSAVDKISFEIMPGEVVGFLGPNGAGKTTTLKMLTGLLYPTSGEARVLGYLPSRREKDFLRGITLVMGNRNQLQWDLPALDSFELNRAIYRIRRGDFVAMRDELIELLEIEDIVRKPVRNLSLGERMKVEIVGSLLHRPRVLFLDEPTIGLDVTMQKRIRAFVAEYNRRYGATVLLTSHYMADVVALCKRVIVIHHGRILFDGVRAEIHPYDVTVETPGAPEAIDCKWGARGINADVLHQLDDATTHAADEDERLSASLVVFDARRSCDVRLGRQTAPHEATRLIALETLDELAHR